MALVFFMIYCLFLFRLTVQLVQYGREVLGRGAAYLIAPVIACGAALSITLTLSGGMLILTCACLFTMVASDIFAR